MNIIESMVLSFLFKYSSNEQSRRLLLANSLTFLFLPAYQSVFCDYYFLNIILIKTVYDGARKQKSKHGLKTSSSFEVEVREPIDK